MTKNIVIVGGGAGGLELVVWLAKKFANDDFYKVVLQSVNDSLDLYSKIVTDDLQVL